MLDRGRLCIPTGYAVKDLENYGFDDRVSAFRLISKACDSGIDTAGRRLDT